MSFSTTVAVVMIWVLTLCGLFFSLRAVLRRRRNRKNGNKS